MKAAACASADPAVNHPPVAALNRSHWTARPPLRPRAYALHTFFSETQLTNPGGKERAGCPLHALALRRKTAFGFYLNDIFIFLAAAIAEQTAFEPGKQLSD